MSLVNDIVLRIQAVVTGQQGITALSTALTGLNSGVQIVQQVTQGVQQLMGGMKEWADEANKAATATKVFELTLSRFAVSTEAANGAAQRLAKEFGLSVTDVQDSMTTLIRAGFRDMGQLEKVMEGAAASSIAFGRTAGEGFDRVADAATTGLSAALNSIGISENLGPALDKYAKSVHKTADALTEQERAQVLANLVMKATATEVGALGTIQNDYVRAQQQADLATKQLHISMGQLFMPVVAQVSTATAQVTQAVVEMVAALKEGKDPLDALALRFPALSRPLLKLGEVITQAKNNFQDAQGIIGPVFERLAPQAQSMVQSVQPALERLGVVFRDMARIGQEAFQRVVIPLFETLAPIAMNAVQRLAPVLASLGELFRDAAQMCVALWEHVLFPVIQKLAPVVQAAIDGVGPILTTLLESVKNLVKFVTDVINGDWAAAWGHLKNAVGNALLAVQGVFENGAKIGEKVKKFGDNLAKQFLAGFLNVSAGIENAIANGLEGAIAKIPDKVKDALAKIGIDLRDVPDALRRDAGKATDAAGDLGGNGSLPPARNIPGFTADKAKSIQAAAAILGVNPNDLAAVISFETAGTFSQSIRNPNSSGTGLIQFMAAEYKNKYGMSRDQFGGLSFEQQMEYVIKYLEQRGVGKNGKNTLADIYQAVAGSGYRRGTQAYELNKVWDSNNDGYISKNEQTLNPRFQAHVRDYFGANQGKGTGYSYETVGRGQFDPKIAIANSVEPGKWTDHFMRTLVEKFKNDPRVDSDCAIIASCVMGELGVKLQGAANDRISAGKLAQQVINSGAQKVGSEAQARSGDFVHFQGANYGYKGSGNHVGMVIGVTPDGKAVILQNPGQGNTQILMLDDVLKANGGKASIYRPKESPYANGQNPAQPAPNTQEQTKATDLLIKRLDELDARYAAHKVTLAEYKKSLQGINAEAQKGFNAAKGLEKDAYKGIATRVKGELAGLNPSATALKSHLLTLEQWNKNQGRAMELAREAAKAEKDLTGARGLQVKAAMEKWAGEDKARQQSYQLAVSLVASQKTHEKELGDLRARVTDEKRQLTVSAAQQEQTRLQELNREELAQFKGTAAQRLALVRRQADDEYNARLAVARATRDKELRESANKGGPNQSERDRQINARFTAEQNAAKNAQSDATREAKKGLQEEASSVQGLTRQYNSLREALLQKGDIGELSAKDMARYAQDLSDLWDSAKKSGLAALPAVQKVHAAAKAFADVAVDHNAASIEKLAKGGAYDTVADQATRAADANGKVRASLDDVLALLPQVEGQWDGFISQMEAMDKQGLLSVGVLQGLKDKVQDLRDSLALEEGDKAGAAALAEVLANPGMYGDRADRTDPNAGKAATQKAQADDLQQTLLALDDATLKSADSLKIYTDMLENAAKNGAITDEQLSDLLDTLNQLKLAASGEEGDIAQLIAEGKTLTDGARGVKPTPQPINRFRDLQDTIFGSLDQLQAGRGFGDWLAAELDKARAAGELTDSELQTLKETLDDLQNLPALNIIPDPDEARFDSWNDKLTKLEEGWKAGEISSKEFAAQAFDSVSALEKLATAADASGKPELAALYRTQAQALAAMVPPADAAAHGQELLKDATNQLAEAQGKGKKPFADTISGLEQLRQQAGVNQVELEKLIAKFKELQAVQEGKDGVQKGIENLDKISGTIGQVGGALSKLAGGTDNGMIDYAVKYMTGGLDIFKKFMSGDIAGMFASAVDWVMNIGDAIENLSPSLQKWKKQLQEIANLEKEAAGSKRYGNIANPYYDELTQDAAAREKLAGSKWYQRLGWSLFGGGPQTMSEEAAKMKSAAAKIFGDVAGDLNSTIENSFMQAFESGDWTGVEAAFEKSMNSLVAKMAVQSIIAASRLQDKIKAYSDARAKALQDGSISSSEQAQLDAYMQDIHNTVKSLKSEAQDALSGLAGYGGNDEFAQLRDNLYNAVKGGIENGAKSALKNAIQKGDMTGLEKAIRESVGDSVLDAMIDSFMNSAAMQAILKPALEKLASAMATDDTGDDDAAWSNFDRVLTTYSQKAADFASKTRDTLTRGGVLGISTGARDGTVTNGTSDYDAALLKYLTDSDPSNDQQALDAYRGKVGGGAAGSGYTIASGGTVSDGNAVGGIIGALQSMTQTAQTMAQAGRDQLRAAGDMLQAARMNLQAAGQRVVDAIEKPRLSFNNG